MILVDANLLIYAHEPAMAEHEVARAWLEGVLNGAAKVGLPWESLVAFLRLRTNARVFPEPLTPAQAWAQIEEWMSLPIVWIPRPTTEHERILGELFEAARPRAGLVHDAHLAAIAIGHGLTVFSRDSDFARFPGVRWEDPLA